MAVEATGLSFVCGSYWVAHLHFVWEGERCALPKFLNPSLPMGAASILDAGLMFLGEDPRGSPIRLVCKGPDSSLPPTPPP